MMSHWRLLMLAGYFQEQPKLWELRRKEDPSVILLVIGPCKQADMEATAKTLGVQVTISPEVK